MPDLTSQISQIKHQMQQLALRHARQLFWLPGDVSQVRQRAAALAASVPGETLWVGQPDTAPADVVACTAKQAHRQLGREFELLVFDAFAGFDPNAFGQVIGTLKAGGLCLLLTPEADKWPAYTDPESSRLVPHPLTAQAAANRFINHLVRVLQSSSVCVWADQLMLAELPAYTLPPAAPAPYRTPEQARLVRLLEQGLRSDRPLPQVVTADRGRGKSAALGLLARQMLAAGFRVQVTAPRREAVASLYQQLAGQGDQVIFTTPDQLLRQPFSADVLLVDEAAAIPAPVLVRLLEACPRIVFASTLHGYEGTGRGFAVRFRRILDKRAPGWQSHTLEQPIRWQRDDPLEALSYRMLMLAAEPGIPEYGLEPRYCRLDRDALLASPVLLESLFGLLVLAHYRTTPGDLRILLDTPGLEAWAAMQGDVPVAAVLAVAEGHLDDSIAVAVMRGERRPQGHLLPQALLAQEGLAEIAPLKGLRVMRIAVHPQCQRRGIGLQLLTVLKQAAAQRGLDWLGTLFGATYDLLPFWSQAGYYTLRLGQSRDPVGGTHAALMLAPLSDAAEQLVEVQRMRFRRSLLHLLPGLLGGLEPELVGHLLPGHKGVLDSAMRCDCETFAYAHRPFESCLPSLAALVSQGTGHWLAAGLTPSDQQLLVESVLQQHAWSLLEQNYGEGRKALIRRLRRLIALLLQAD